MSNRRRLRSPLQFGRGWNLSATVITVGGLVASAVGVADAATGGTFLLGKVNRETRAATLSNRKGIPLSLKAKSGSPPLRVNSSKLVPKLNANFVGGLSAAQLQRRSAGSCPTGIESIGPTGAVTCARTRRLVFTHNGSVIIPKGVTQVTGELWGGGGAGGASYEYYGTAGGAGGYERVTIPVTPGQVLNVVVGGGGATNYRYDSFGGGASSLQTTDGSVLAGASGGSGGTTAAASCPDAAGGTPMPLASGVVGLDARDGATGHCGTSPTGRPGFAGTGGAPGASALSVTYGSAGEPGMVIVSFVD